MIKTHVIRWWAHLSLWRIIHIPVWHDRVYPQGNLSLGRSSSIFSADPGDLVHHSGFLHLSYWCSFSSWEGEYQEDWGWPSFLALGPHPGSDQKLWWFCLHCRGKWWEVLCYVKDWLTNSKSMSQYICQFSFYDNIVLFYMKKCSLQYVGRHMLSKKRNTIATHVICIFFPVFFGGFSKLGKLQL